MLKPEPFGDVLMVCPLCDAQEQSDFDVENDWRSFDMDGTRYYVCSAHFPEDGAPEAECRRAYQEVFRRLRGIGTEEKDAS